MWKEMPNFAQFFNTHCIVGKFTEYKLPLKSMPVGTQTFEYRIGKQFFVNMESTDIHDADIDVSLTVVHKNDIYSLSFRIKGVLTLICDRCLDNLEWPIDTTYDFSVKYGEDYNDDSDELLIIPESDNYLNVAYMLYDTIALTIPIKHVHPAGKCNRQMSAILKMHRAANPAFEDNEFEDSEFTDETDSAGTSGRATDPRWDALKNIDTQQN